MNIILFDGICNLCNGVVSFIIKRDKKALFRFAAIQSGAGQTLLSLYGATNNKQDLTLYYIRGEKYFCKSSAVIFILKDLGGMWKCFYPFIFLPTRFRDAIYLFIARHRYRWFGKRETCLIPDKRIQDRFIEDLFT